MTAICFYLAMAVAAASAITAFIIGVKKGGGSRWLSPIKILFFGVFAASFLLHLPVIVKMQGLAAPRFSSVFLSLHSTFQIFTIDSDRSLIIDELSGMNMENAYRTAMSVLFVLAPILTFGFVLSFFNNISSRLRFLWSFNKEVYVFTDLNEASSTLAEDLRRNHSDAAIVFADVTDNGDDAYDELYSRTRRIKAICFKKNVSSVSLRPHNIKAQITFFVIDRHEKDNIETALELSKKYEARPNTRMFVFSTNPESELLFTSASNDCLKVRRINTARSLINRTLYENGERFFKHALPVSKNEKRISAVIVGLGTRGREMLKALAWFCQMDGYSVIIDAFDSDPLAEKKMAAMCPELLSPDYNGVSVPGESEYLIRIHPGMDVSSSDFIDEINKLTGTTYVLVSLGSDEKNIRTAADLRMRFERIGAKPDIDAIVFSTASSNALSNVKNYRGQSYDVNFIGDIGTSYSERVIIDSELETEALARHLKWGCEDEFWRYEYNYNSSVASAIHMKARIACGIPGAEKNEADLTEEEADLIERIEHRRWNAYMRSEGYVYSGSHEKSSRNDLGKMHHDLVDFASLDEAEKRKDRISGTN